MIWHELITRQVRDLAWACFSEPLIISSALDSRLRNLSLELTERRIKWLIKIDRVPGELLHYLNQEKSTRLGIYFERLWQFFLMHDEQLELLGHNLPVREGNRTLGEFDLIFRDLTDGQSYHLELALKYYLGLPNSDTWLGPGKQDQLALKLQHLLERQTRLAEHPAALSTLKQLRIEDPQPLMEIKGYLFEHASTETTRPPGYNPDNPIRTWLTVEGFKSRGSSERWQPLEREQWLSPFSSAPQDESPGNIDDWLHKNVVGREMPQMLCKLDEAGNEAERLFVVPNDWADA